MSLVKMHGRRSFSTSFCVEGGFGIPGDSGAWVYDPASGGLCGHVLAWGEKSKTAYIAPMEVLFDDIKRTLGADGVELPNAIPARPKHEDSGIGMGKTPAAEMDGAVAKLRDLRLDEARGAAAAAPAPGAPGGGGAGAAGGAKAKGVVGVRPLVMAGAVS